MTTLKQSLTKILLEHTLINVETRIKDFIDKLADTYGLDKNEILGMWSDDPVEEKKKNVLCSIDTDDISLGRLAKCSKNELVSLCKTHKHKCTGTKDQLIERLIGKNTSDKPSVESKEKSSKEKVIKGSSLKASEKIKSEPKVIKKLSESVTVLSIRKNQFGNLEHPETSLVFERKNHKVIGKQEDDGTVSDLTDDDIQQCKKYKFNYTLPNNLDKNKIDIEDALTEDSVTEDIPVVEDDVNEEEEDVEELEDEDAEIEDD
jgi:hypothetical protein